MTSAVNPSDLGCVSYLRQEHWRFAWELMLRRLAVLTSEHHCQMLRGLIKQMTDGIIWRLSLITQSGIIQFNRLPAFWKQVEGRCLRIPPSNMWSLLYRILSPLPGSCPFCLMLWVLNSSRENSLDFLWAGHIGGWVDKKWKGQPFCNASEKPTTLSNTFLLWPCCLLHSLPTAPTPMYFLLFLGDSLFWVLQGWINWLLISMSFDRGWVIILPNLLSFSLSFHSLIFVKTSHPWLFPPTFHVCLINAFLGFEKERR